MISLVADSSPEARRPTSSWHHGAGASRMSSRLRSTVGPTRICMPADSAGTPSGVSSQTVPSAVLEPLAAVNTGTP